MTLKIAVMPGDGIGPEITAQAVKVLEALKTDGLNIEFEHALIGGVAYREKGIPLPDETVALAKASDAVLFRCSGRFFTGHPSKAPASRASHSWHSQGIEPVCQLPTSHGLRRVGRCINLAP